MIGGFQRAAIDLPEAKPEALQPQRMIGSERFQVGLGAGRHACYSRPPTACRPSSGGATFDTHGHALEIDAVIGSANSGGAAGGITVMDSSTTGGGVLRLTSYNMNMYQGGTTIAKGMIEFVGNAA